MHSLTDQLTTLETSGLIRLAQMEPELEYLFRHSLVQEATYESILRTDRRILHRTVAETLAQLYPNRITDLASTLAIHFLEAGEKEQARYYFIIAGDHAMVQFANTEAEKHFRAALGLGGMAVEQASVLAKLGEAFFNQGKFDEAIEHWRNGINQYRDTDDYSAIAQLYARIAAAKWETYDEPGQLAVCREGLALLDEQLDTSGAAYLLQTITRACINNGLLEEAEKFSWRTLELAEKLGVVNIKAEIMVDLAWLLPWISAQPLYEQVIALCEAADLWKEAIKAHEEFGFRLLTQGQFQAARFHFLRETEIAHRIGQAPSEFYGACLMNFTTTFLGDLITAESELAQLRLMLKAIEPYERGTIEMAWAEAAWLFERGEVRKAIAGYRRLADSMREKRNFADLTIVNHYLAEALLEVGEWREAETVSLETTPYENQGFSQGFPQPGAQLSLTQLGQGRLAEARQTLIEAQAKANPDPTPIERALFFSVEAQLFAAENQWLDAFRAFEKGLDAYTLVERRWYRPNLLSKWAEAHIARGEPDDNDQARELLREALAEFEAMNATEYAYQVRQRLQSLSP